jgi:hypothetical protein
MQTIIERMRAEIIDNEKTMDALEVRVERMNQQLQEIMRRVDILVSNTEEVTLAACLPSSYSSHPLPPTWTID